ncbi:MAG: cyclase, partial [Flammeovirgaceae bacterium]
KTFAELVREIAQHLNIPFTVGGGINSVEDAEKLLEAGADKVSINSSAVRNPELINQMAEAFGSQFVVVAIDGKQVNGEWEVFVSGGKIPTGKELFAWAKEAEERGAGEILFTSMNSDGTKAGFAVEALRKMSDLLSIPIIASGGAGSMEHFTDVFKNGKADAALAASIFHFKEIGIGELKNYLKEEGLEMRI